MVSIAVHMRSPPSPESLNHRSGLRGSGVWYPTVPPRSLCLNEASFPPLDSYVEVGYRPLFWCHFGGPGGSYLPHLTGISVSKSSTFFSGLLRIEFHFDEEVPDEHRSFGRLKDERHEDVIDFSIDGPGGERIATIEMRHQYPDAECAPPRVVQEGAMVGCKVCLRSPRLCRL